MSIKASVFIATSLDGFIARANGDLGWLTGEESTSTEQDYGYQEFMDSVDNLVVGRNTFERVLTFDTWPYSGKKVVVLSSKPNAVPQHLTDSVEWLSLPPQHLVERLVSQGATHLYVDGGKTIQGFVKAGLINELIVTRIPVLIGTGIPLFGPLNHDIKLTHVATRQFENGFVQSTHRVPSSFAKKAAVSSTGRCNTVGFRCCSDRRCRSGEAGSSWRVVRGAQAGVVGAMEGRRVYQRHLQSSKETPRLHPRDAQGHRRHRSASTVQAEVDAELGRAGGDLSGARIRRFDARHRRPPGPGDLDRKSGS